MGEIIIPKKGIRETVTNVLSISKKTEILLDELKFLWIIPYKLDKVSPITNGKISTYGNIYQNISLTFRYDKIWKWGEITNTIEECCFFILEYAKDVGDFYVITGKNNVQDFINEVIIPNQYGTRCAWASEVLDAWSKPNPEDDSLVKTDSENEEVNNQVIIPNKYRTRSLWASPEDDSLIKTDSENEEANNAYQLHLSDGKIYDPICINKIRNGRIYEPTFIKNSDESGKTDTAKEQDSNADILPDGVMIPKVSDYFFDEFMALSRESKREVLENLKNIIDSEDENEDDVMKSIIEADAEIRAQAESVKKELIREKYEDTIKSLKEAIEDVKHVEDTIKKSIQIMIKNDETGKSVLDEISKKWKLYFNANASHPTNPCTECIPKDDEK